MSPPRAGASARLYEVEIFHVRAQPIRHELRHRGYLWFVDLDDLPPLPRGLRWLARFDSRDFLGDPANSLRGNLDRYLAEHGIDLSGGRITMLASARSAGYLFNPLSVFWCHDRSGRLECVVAEVHNTYGERYRYLVRTDEGGRAEAEKAFYVSPFYPVDGYYRLRLPEPRDRLSLSVTLHRPGERPFVATVRGAAVPATTRDVIATAARHPFETWLVRALITMHGVALWARRVPVQPRPTQRADHRVRRGIPRRS